MEWESTNLIRSGLARPSQAHRPLLSKRQMMKPMPGASIGVRVRIGSSCSGRAKWERTFQR